MPKRKQIRLQNYDYSQNGAYFVTVCTKEKRKIFGDIVGDGVLDVPFVQLSDYGKIVDRRICAINRHYTNLTITKYVIMPNHIHVIVEIQNGDDDGRERGTSRTPSPTKTRDTANKILPALVSTLKRFTNKEAGTELWQRSYYEHVIRNDIDYREIWDYIDQNPADWAEGRERQL